MIDKKLLEELIFEAPLALLGLKDEESIQAANSYLPYSTGFEIECHKSDTYNESIFRTIPNIIAVQVDSCEQRYRIPNGINGLICLYDVCYHLNTNSLLNMGSGIHYHIDCQIDDTFELLTDKVLDHNSSWILPELDEWKFGGSQLRNIGSKGSWIRRNWLNTLEFRIGNMSFDYKVLVKNIISANSIVKRLKDGLNITIIEPVYKTVDTNTILMYQKSKSRAGISYANKIANLNQKLTEMNTKPTIVNSLEVAKQSIKSKTHKIN